MKAVLTVSDCSPYTVSEGSLVVKAVFAVGKAVFTVSKGSLNCQ